MHRPLLEVEQFDGQCVFAVAAGGDGVYFSLTFWTVWRSFAWCILRPCIQYKAGAASTAGACFIHWPVPVGLQCGSEFYVICNELATEQRQDERVSGRYLDSQNLDSEIPRRYLHS